MEANKLNSAVEKAKDAVKDLEEPLKSKAFEILLNKLLNEQSAHQEIQSVNKDPGYDADIGDKLANDINSSEHPALYQLQKALDRALYILFIAKNNHHVDGLTPSQISKILSVKFRIAETPNAIGMALMKAGDRVDRRQISSEGGIGYQYRIMHRGEEYVQNQTKEPSSTIPKIKPKKTQIRITRPTKGDSARDRIMALVKENYFAEPKEATEVTTELATRGHHYDSDVLRTILLRIVKKQQLRRIRASKGTGFVYKYCNP